MIKDKTELEQCLQYVYDNLHKWRGTTGPGCVEWVERTREALNQARAERLNIPRNGQGPWN